ncbi:MAG: discoidin domain-containing protein [Anaerolineales bacterium]|nr:discoidin domain-containing protein [Anaerolineales bacterium]
MINLLLRRPVLGALAVVAVGLACAYADVPIVPARGQVLVTPVAFVASDTPAPPDTATAAPTDTAAAPTDTAGPPTAAPTTGAPPTAGPATATATLVVELTATETAATPETSGEAATATPEGPTAEPSATLEAAFTRAYTATADGDFPYGLVRALSDGQITTWVSLRNGQGVWSFDLGAPAAVAGVRLYAHRDRNQDTTLLAVEYSQDGQTWQPLYTPAATCGATPACAVVPQDVNYDLPFGPVSARYFRLRSGPTALALAEVQFAVMP